MLMAWLLHHHGTSSYVIHMVCVEKSIVSTSWVKLNSMYYLNVYVLCASLLLTVYLDLNQKHLSGISLFVFHFSSIWIFMF